MLLTLLTLFAKIIDNRRPQARKYDAPHLLLFSLLALLAGYNKYTDMAMYIETHLDELKELTGCTRERHPAHSTINYFFITLNLESLETIFREHALSLLPEGCDLEHAHIATDGKCLRGSYDNAEGTHALQIVSSFLVKYSIVLSHEFIEGKKTNEIPVIQDIFKRLDIHKPVHTVDALHCQKKR